jgi:hypothetical protein
MAQAASLQDPPIPTPDNLGSADEVLSQLAGSEIDRLLAEAETAPEPAPPTAAPAVEPSALKPPVSPAASVESELGLDEATLNNQLDELFDKLQEETVPKPPAPAPAEPAPPAPAAEAPAPASVLAPETEGTEGNEKAALLEAAGFDAGAKQPETVAAESAPAASPEAKTPPAAAPVETSVSEKSAVLNAAGFENVEGPLPIWLKPLEWINAPVRHSSPAVRQALGRAAILTLVNALLVLSYLAMTHKH